MADITLTDYWLVGATFLGPVLAVQAQKFIERATEKRRRKLNIFYTLMATRATRLANERVQALNMIDLEFGPRRFGFQSAKDKAVSIAWRNLFDELTNGVAPNEQDQQRIETWDARCNDRSADLLLAISVALGFTFTRVDLVRNAYYPRSHAELETAQREIFGNLRRLLAGGSSLPVRIVEFEHRSEH